MNTNETAAMSRCLLTPQEVADAFGVKLRTVLWWIAKGRLKSVRISRKFRRIRPEDLDAYLTGLNPDPAQARERRRMSALDRQTRRDLGLPD